MKRTSPPLLRTRVRRAMVLLAAAAIVLFGVPLAVAVERLLSGAALSALQRDATRAVAAVPDNTLQTGVKVALPRATTATRLGLYDATGRRVGGAGPARSALAGLSGDGKEHHGNEAGQLVVASPVLSDTTVAGSVRAELPLSVLRRRVLEAWGGLVALAVLVLAVTALLARRASRRIAEPFEQITRAARTLGAGSFDVALPGWGLAEADAAGKALQETGRELETLVRHEREFVRYASHQLRTPLSALVVQLEQLQAGADPETTAAAALDRAHHLEATISDLLAVRTPAGRETCDPRLVAEELAARWRRTTTRDLVLRADDVDRVAVPGAALRQALEVLLDNALRHGAGTVTVTIEPLGDWVVVEVADEGAGFGDDHEPGTGLVLATSLVERFGGDLLVRRRTPCPRVALLLPLQSSSNR
ncbi:MAG: Histidine kinase [Frankiales bacterium]|nr:Histidine kinase [Frankiales bacterium]